MRSFLLTVHEPGSVVLEDLRTRRRVRVVELADVAGQVAVWLDETDAPVVSADTPGSTRSTSAPEPAL